MNIFVIAGVDRPVPPLTFGPQEHLIAGCVIEFIKKGHQVFLFTVAPSSLRGTFVDHKGSGGTLRTFESATAGLPTEKYHYYKYKKVLEEVFESTDDNVKDSIVWDNTDMGYVYLSALKNKKIKIIHTHHGQMNEYWHSSPPPIAYPRLVGLSNNHCSYLEGVVRKVPVRRIYPGIQITDGKEIETKTKQAQNEYGDDFGDYLLCLNRIAPEKGIHIAIDVALQARKKIKIVGDTLFSVAHDVQSQRYVSDIMNKCRDSGGLAQYIGHVDPHTKERYIAGCKAMIHTPLTGYVDPFPYGIIEGLSFGKHTYTLSNDPIYSPFKNINDLVDHVRWGTMDKFEEPDKLKENAKEFSIQKCAENYLEHFEKILADDGAYKW